MPTPTPLPELSGGWSPGRLILAPTERFAVARCDHYDGRIATISADGSIAMSHGVHPDDRPVVEAWLRAALALHRFATTPTANDRAPVAVDEAHGWVWGPDTFSDDEALHHADGDLAAVVGEPDPDDIAWAAFRPRAPSVVALIASGPETGDDGRACAIKALCDAGYRGPLGWEPPVAVAAEEPSPWRRFADERPPVGARIFVRGDADFREDVAREVVANLDDPDDDGTHVRTVGGDRAVTKGCVLLGAALYVYSVAEWRPAPDANERARAADCAEITDVHDATGGDR